MPNLNHSARRHRHPFLARTLLLAWVGWALNAHADSTPIPFSAEVTRSRPEIVQEGARPPVPSARGASPREVPQKKWIQTRGKLFVSPDGVRGESQRDDIPVVMIHLAKEKTLWILLPKQKTYSERKGVSQNRPPLPDDPDGPCRRDKSLICRQVGTEKIDSRQTIHWEISQRGPDQREIPQAHLWIDPRLGIAIREQYMDGLQVELSNIQEGTQPVELFQIPKDYQKQAP